MKYSKRQILCNRALVVGLTVLFILSIQQVKRSKQIFDIGQANQIKVGLLKGELEILKVEQEEQLEEINSLGITSQELMDLAVEGQAVKEEKMEKQETVKPTRGTTRKGETVQARVTAYASLDNQSGICAQGDPNITSTGSQVRRGIIAVDPKKIPYGSLVYVPGYGEAIAEDTGGALRSYNGIAIDIWVESYDEAMQWGKQDLEVTILRRGK